MHGLTSTPAINQVLSTHGDVGLTIGLGGGALGVFLTTVLVGILLVAIAPAYTERMTDELFDSPLYSFLAGLFFLLVLVIVTVVLLITIVGILVAIALVAITYVVWAIGSTLAFLAIGQRLVDGSDEWKIPLLIGAGLNGALALTGFGALVSFCVGAVGFGAILTDRFGG